MALVRLLRGGQVTLPAEVRQRLKLAQGDYLEAEVVEDGVSLKPVSDVEREKALKQMFGARGPRPATPEQAKKSPEAQGREVRRCGANILMAVLDNTTAIPTESSTLPGS
jgi:AbrB family looped-hinge helix DNA binding protein